MADLILRKVSCVAPAKINLALHVTGQQNDGYHLLDSLVAFTTCGDTISIKASPEITKGAVECQFGGPFGKQLEKALARNDDHLILKAVAHFMESFGSLPSGIAIQLDKALPIASGIGGGSADASATLLALRKLYGGVPLSDLLAIGKKLGADVPMCIHSQALLAQGIGTQIKLVERIPKLYLLLVNPGIEVSTPQIFKSLASKNNTPLPPLPVQLTITNLIDWLACQRNDLESAAIALAPQISDISFSVAPQQCKAGTNEWIGRDMLWTFRKRSGLQNCR